MSLPLVNNDTNSIAKYLGRLSVVSVDVSLPIGYQLWLWIKQIRMNQGILPSMSLTLLHWVERHSCSHSPSVAVHATRIPSTAVFLQNASIMTVHSFSSASQKWHWIDHSLWGETSGEVSQRTSVRRRRALIWAQGEHIIQNHVLKRHEGV